VNATDEKADVRKIKLKESQKKDGGRQGLKPEGIQSRQFLQAQWQITEDLQNAYPYCEIGWYGFIPCMILH